MHDTEHFLESVSGGLGLFYLLACLMNWVAAFMLWRKGSVPYFKLGSLTITNVFLWTVVGGIFLVLSPFAYIGSPFPIFRFFPFNPWLEGAWDTLRGTVNFLSNPIVFTVGSFGLLIGLFVTRQTWSKPAVAWGIFNLSLVAMGASMTDPSFAEIVKKPDNVPIVGLIYLLGYFTWLATHKAVVNDERIARGLPPLEKEESDKVLVWPDLVYTELICMVILTVVLLVWGICLQAPLEEPASSVKTPNPSKAPWYFLGLQEMLVYFDPWYAGVVLPSIVLFGLMAIPYLDFNRKGSGYFTINERKFAYCVFQIGFLQLWVVLIILGTFFRGPNWNFFGPFESWNPYKVEALNNVNLSDYFWISLMNSNLPRAPQGSGAILQLLYIVLRESPGIVLVLGYLVVLPPFLAMTLLRKFFVKMGLIRYMMFSSLLLLMASLPVKMLLRWIFDLKYLIYIPEYFLNF